MDTKTPSTARMYDYYLGGKNHYPADRDAAEKVLATIPELRDTVVENRGFLQRAVRSMAQAGIRQFLDLGAGLPTQENVHQVAQHENPQARVVYVDNDPVTLVHAHALLETNAQTAVVDADLRHPDRIVNDSTVTDMIDFDEPVGVLLIAMLHFVTDDEDPGHIVQTFRETLASGSYLALSHASAEHLSADTQARSSRASQVYQQATSAITLRTRDQIRDLFTGFEILDPGVVPLSHWRPADAQASETPTLGYAGLGYKQES